MWRYQDVLDPQENLLREVLSHPFPKTSCHYLVQLHEHCFRALLGFVLADVGLPVGPPGLLPRPLALLGRDPATVCTPADVMRRGRKYANRNQLQLIVAISLLRVALK